MRSLGPTARHPGPHTGPTGAPDCDDDRPHPNGRRAPDANSTSREDQTVTVAATARRHCTDDADVALRFDALSAADPALSADLAKDDGSRGGSLGDAGVPLSLRAVAELRPPTTARAVLENTHLATALQTLTARPGDAVGIGACGRYDGRCWVRRPCSRRSLRHCAGATPTPSTSTSRSTRRPPGRSTRCREPARRCTSCATPAGPRNGAHRPAPRPANR